jgi:hypothetical protein
LKSARIGPPGRLSMRSGPLRPLPRLVKTSTG